MNNHYDTTIAAISTAMSNAGIMMSCLLMTSSLLSVKKVLRKNSSILLTTSTLLESRSLSPAISPLKILRRWKQGLGLVSSGA